MTAPLVNFSGLASGFDYRALVDAIIAQERQPAVRLENQVSTYASQQTALDGYRTRLAALKTASTALRTGSAFDATTATTTILSGTRALATVSTSSSAQSGNHTLQVSQLARAERLAGTGQADATAALGMTGTFSIQGVEIEITTTDSLAAIRDRINALNSGSDPLGVNASILSVSATEHRLVLTATETGAAGISLAEVSGTALQSLGLLDGAGQKQAGAVLVTGADAQFSIDGIAMTRTSNVVADALEGVTITLTADDAGAVTGIAVGRYADAARNALQGFVEAFNGLIDFVKAQGVATDDSRPALYNDPLLRSIRRDLPTTLLGEVFGTAPDLATAASAGLSLTRDGKLTFDAAKFDTAFSTRLPELRLLFGETSTSSSAELSFVTSGRSTSSGTWNVEITAPATRAGITTSGFSGSYDAGVTPDTMTVTDTRSGKSVNVELVTGMSTSDIITALEDAIAAEGLAIDVEASGNDIALPIVQPGGHRVELIRFGLGNRTRVHRPG
ncbi:MAG TPA: flagellar filament capping protein FliD [Gemmatimonadales bacterium]|nr:flagellar filament capping protein FliD [Gemmatimonadales bacterium]